MQTEWNDRFPSRTALRAEVRAMVETIREVLLAELGEANIRGIYHKGSGQRAWDTVIDYVPEISDVDVHVWLADDHLEEILFQDLDLALRIQAGLEQGYRQRVARPHHLPRPQVMALNHLEQEPDYVPSPPGVVDVLYGEPYPTAGRQPDAEIRRIDAERLAVDFDASADFPQKALDKPGRYMWTFVRNLAWRVSPTGARVLDLLGMDPERSWSLNRTGVVQALQAHGQEPLAAKISEYYLAGWDYFLSGFQDTAAGRRLIRHGVDAIALGYAVLSPPPPGQR